jgi:hypothetical protein
MGWFNRSCDAVAWGLVATVLLLSACEESLPPRIHPSDIDPEGFLEQSFDSESGVVMYTGSDTISQSTAGTLYLDVRNIHDEVLSGTEDITIDVEYWSPDFPGDTIRVVGDRDNLVNPFNFQGDVFMLDGDILTIHPDSSARFQIQMDHTAEGLWVYGNPVYTMDSCFFPPCGERVTTDEIRMTARASIRLFENQTIPLFTDEVDLTIWYFFEVIAYSSVEVENITAWVDSGSVKVQWITSYQWRVHHFEVQKSMEVSDGFGTISNGIIAPQGAAADTVEYLVTETDPPSGTWYYRVAIFEEFRLVGPLYVSSFGRVQVVVP